MTTALIASVAVAGFFMFLKWGADNAHKEKKEIRRQLHPQDVTGVCGYRYATTQQGQRPVAYPPRPGILLPMQEGNDHLTTHQATTSPTLKVISGSRPDGAETINHLVCKMLSKDPDESRQGFEDFHAFATRCKARGQLTRVK